MEQKVKNNKAIVIDSVQFFVSHVLNSRTNSSEEIIYRGQASKD